MTARKDGTPKRKGVAVLAPDLGLSDQEMRFVDHYVVGFKSKQSAIDAGYSKNGADVQAARLLGRGAIQNEITRRLTKQAAKCSKTAEDVVEELVKLGFSNMGDYVKVNNQGLPYVNLADLPPEKMAAIQEVTVESYVEKGASEEGEVEEREVKKVKLKLYDKRASLVDLGKHLGIFKENKDTTPQDFEFTISIGTRNGPNGSEAAAKVQIRPSMGVRETE